MPDPDPLRSRRDDQLAQGLARALKRDGWSAAWRRQADGRWLARVACPRPPIAVEAAGSSRVSSISAAHVRAVRLAFAPVHRTYNPGACPC